MKNFVALLVLFAPFALAAQDLIIPAGTQRILTPEERILSLKKLSLGDNVTIIIPPSMNGWTVTATDVTIGNNVKIIGVITHGYGGMGGGSAANAHDCLQGMSGMNGANASAGLPGKNVSMTLKIRRIGSLYIEVNGGMGGYGGNGGNGGRGGNATCHCNAGKGGNGGRGGNGGNGGAGGNVSISYSKFGNVDVSNSNFTIRALGGAAGIGGSGGTGGQGGTSVCSDPKAGVKAAGALGTNGARGVDGIPGRNGSSTISGR